MHNAGSLICANYFPTLTNPIAIFARLNTPTLTVEFDYLTIQIARILHKHGKFNYASITSYPMIYPGQLILPKTIF